MAILTGSFIVLLALGLPIGIVLAGASLLFIMQDPLLSEATVFRSFFNFVSKYTLMAVPFFIYAGFLMERTGLIDRLFRFADALIGWVPGGFGFATLLAAIIFGAISGSSTAMAAAMGVIAYPEMRRRGYPAWLAAGLIASGGGIAILIPPSITLILYGVMTETSIVSLFFAGVVPGLLLALGNAVALVFFALYLKLPSGEFRWRALLDAAKEAWPALLMPVIILGGLYGGLFTPTEAGAAACGYALIYGAIARRRAFLADLVAVTQRSLNLTAVIIFLLGCVGVFQFVLANLGAAPDAMGRQSRPLAARLPGGADADPAVPVHVPLRHRHRGADGAAVLPDRHGARDRSRLPRHPGGAGDGDGGHHPARGAQPVRRRGHHAGAAARGDLGLLALPAGGWLRAAAGDVLPDPGVVAAGPARGAGVQLASDPQGRPPRSGASAAWQEAGARSTKADHAVGAASAGSASAGAGGWRPRIRSAAFSAIISVGA